MSGVGHKRTLALVTNYFSVIFRIQGMYLEYSTSNSLIPSKSLYGRMSWCMNRFLLSFSLFWNSLFSGYSYLSSFLCALRKPIRSFSTFQRLCSTFARISASLSVSEAISLLVSSILSPRKDLKIASFTGIVYAL